MTHTANYGISTPSLRLHDPHQDCYCKFLIFKELGTQIETGPNLGQKLAHVLPCAGDVTRVTKAGVSAVMSLII